MTIRVSELTLMRTCNLFRMHHRTLPLLVAGLLTACAGAQTPSPVKVQLQSYVSGIANITDITHAGDDRLFVTRRNGVIRVIDGDGQLLATPFLTIPVNNGTSEQGLLGLAFDPDYANNGYFYVNYTLGAGTGSTRVARFKVSEGDPNVADPNSAVPILTVPQPYWNHNGGDLAFGPDGHLYISFGDGGDGGDPDQYGQNMNSALGKVLRIDVSSLPYSVPPDNPFVDAVSDTLPEIWAAGLRNPWRMGFDRLTGDLWLGDVGQNTWEELDFWPAGDNSGPNFGWRCYEGLVTFNLEDCGPASGMVPPIRVHPTNQWCAIIGGRVYRGEQFHRLYGRYIYTDHCYGRIFSQHPDGIGGWVTEQLTTTGGSGASVIAENAAGELFLGNHGNGTVYRIVDVCPMPQPVITADGVVLTSTEANGYTWFLEGVVIDGATGQTYTAEVNGSYSVLADHGTDCLLLSEPVQVTSTATTELANDAVRVHPIPTGDQLVVAGLDATATVIRLLDMQGREKLQHRVTTHGEQRLDLSRLAVGSYILIALDESGRELVKRTVSVAR